MSIAMTTEFEDDRTHETQRAAPQPMPVPVQVLSTILFAAFAIPVTIVALNIFWPAGIALAVILAWRGGFAPGNLVQSVEPIETTVRALIPTQEKRSSGNASFDAYRTDMLARLETEQENFEGFLGRLRDAKDQTEFEQFMDDRAAKISHDS